MVKELSKWMIFLILAGCGSNESAVELLNRSLDAHGGLEAYQNLATISYSKTTILYDSSGEVESNIKQLHKYYFGDVVSGSITWASDEDSHRVEFSGPDVKKYVNDSLIEDSSAPGLVNSSMYVLFQPFKLKDPGVQVTTESMKWLESDMAYTTLVPVFEGGSNDTWWFYLDPDNFTIKANLVKHNNRYSFIENLEFEETDLLLLHKHRKSYFTDSLLSKRLLRAEYFYENYWLD